jgi:hypothetical protein
VRDERDLRDEKARTDVERGLVREEREDVLLERHSHLGFDAGDVAVDVRIRFRQSVTVARESLFEVVEAEIDERAARHLVGQLGLEILGREGEVLVGQKRRSLDHRPVFPGGEREGHRGDLAAEERIERLGRQSLLCRDLLLNSASVYVDHGERVLVHLVHRVLVVARALERTAFPSGLEMVECGLALGEGRPAVDVARHHVRVELREDVLQLLDIVGLGEADELAFAGEVEADDVGLRAERRLDVTLEVDVLAAQLAKNRIDRAPTVGKLGDEVFRLLPLLGIGVGTDADEERSARGRDGRAGRAGGSALLPATDREGEQSDDEDCECAHVIHLSAADPSTLRLVPGGLHRQGQSTRPP